MESVGHRVRRISDEIREFTVEMELTQEGAEFLETILDDDTGRATDGGGATPASPPGRREERMGTMETAWCYNCQGERSVGQNGFGQTACSTCTSRIACAQCGGCAGAEHRCNRVLFCGRCQRFRNTHHYGGHRRCSYCDRNISCFGCGDGIIDAIPHSCSYTQRPDPEAKHDRNLYCNRCKRTRKFRLLEAEDGKFRICRACNQYYTCATCLAICPDEPVHECPLALIENDEDEDEDGYGEDESPYGDLQPLEISLGHGAKLEFRLPAAWHSTVKNLSPRLMPGSTYRREVYNAIMACNHAFYVRDFFTAEALYQKAKALAA